MNVASLEMMAWLAGTVALYWLAPERLRHLVLAAVTAVFLALQAPHSLVLLAVFTAATYYVPRLAAFSPRALTAVGAAILAVLVSFKAGLVAPAAAQSATGFFPRVVMPLGLSYYSFRCIHYLIEEYKGNLPRHDFGQFVGYLFFLPTLVAGPIHRFPDYVRDLRRQRWDGRNFSEGCERILYGAVQIVILGNYLASTKLRDVIAGLDPAQVWLIAWADCVRFGLNAYFQFAGYSSVAVGFALLLGFRVIENFNWPLLRRNISDFWRAWHISLSGWCRDYVYMPVVSLSRNVALGALLTMVAIGLWHELSVRYLLWGVYHAVGIIVWQGFQKLKPRLPRTEEGSIARLAADGLSVLLTFNFVMLSFAIVKEDSLAETLGVFRTVLFGWW